MSLEKSITPQPRLGFVINSLKLGGAEIQLIHQVNALHEQGYEVFLLILSEACPLLPTVHLPTKQVMIIPHPFVNLLFKDLLKSPVLLPHINRFLNQNHIDVVFSVLPISNFLMRVAKIVRAFSFQKRFHLIAYHCNEKYSMLPLKRWDKRLFCWVDNLLARWSDDANIYVSSAVKKGIQAHLFGCNPFVVFNAIPLKQTTNATTIESEKQSLPMVINEQPLNWKRTAFHILLPGRLTESKGHLFFLEVFKALIDALKLSPEMICLTVVGDGHLYKVIEKKIQKLKLDYYCNMVGAVDNETMLLFMQKANLVAIPSLFEGFGIVAIEAMQQKTLVLAAAIGGLTDIITHKENGFLFEVANPTACLTQLTYLYENRNTNLIDPEVIYEDFKNRFTLKQHIQELLTVVDFVCKKSTT